MSTVWVWGCRHEWAEPTDGEQYRPERELAVRDSASYCAVRQHGYRPSRATLRPGDIDLPEGEVDESGDYRVWYSPRNAYGLSWRVRMSLGSTRTATTSVVDRPVCANQCSAPWAPTSLTSAAYDRGDLPSPTGGSRPSRRRAQGIRSRYPLPPYHG